MCRNSESRGGTQGFGATARLDLSSCVNRYGPVPESVRALAALSADSLQYHPYEAAPRLAASYARAMAVPQSQVVAGRGTTEFIWAAAFMAKGQVGLPRPTYTDFIRAFPQAKYYDSGMPWITLETIDAAASFSDIVVFSNPQNPSGWYMPADELISVISAHPCVYFVVDESYIDFLTDPRSASIVGLAGLNAVVLRSPSKFYGIAGARAGIAWSPNLESLSALRLRQDTWPLSALDAGVAEAALGSIAWAKEIRQRLRGDGHWLESYLSNQVGADPAASSELHYRLYVGEAAESVEQFLSERQVVARVLSARHGFTHSALRVTAPRVDERELL